MKIIHKQMMDNDGTIEVREKVSPTITLAAVGDLAFHGPVLEAITQDPKSFFPGPVQEIVRSADISIGNLESVLVDHPFSPVSGKAFLIAGFQALPVLQDAGFDILTFANNHVLDAGSDNLVHCLERLKTTKMATTGAGKTTADARIPVRSKIGEMELVVFAYSYGCGQIVGPQQPGCNEANLRTILQDLKNFSKPRDIKIVCLHMDAEFQETPAPDRMEFCRALADAGVQIILCHHPHVPQGLEMRDKSLIVYSLGNFVFPMMPYLLASSPDCDKSFLLEVEIDQEGPVGIRVVPVVLDEQGRPVPPEPEVRQELLAMISQRSEQLLNPVTVRTNYSQMTHRYSKDLLQHIYWAAGERDWQKIRLFLQSLRHSATHRRWLRHFFRNKLTGR